jgi:hypothetical protein
MAFVQTTSTGWFGRIGNSIKGMLFGLLLVPVAIIVLIVNERNAVRDIRANEEIGAKVQSVSSDVVDPANEGRLVHLNGPARTDELLKNDEFGIEEKAIRISWKALIYQWKETSEENNRKKLGGGEETTTTYRYEKVWSPEAIDSSGFREKGHDNRGKQTFRSASVEAQHVTLGAFTLPPGLISRIQSSEPLVFTEVPTPLAERGHVSGGVFHTGDSSSPQIGDEKVEFSITRPGNVSVLAVQSGDGFKPYVADNGKQKFLLYEGLLSAREVVKGEERKAMLLRWVLRVGGLLFMFFGLILLMNPLSVFADVMPLLGSFVGLLSGGLAFLLSCAISILVISLSWLAFRPWIGIPLLALAVGCFIALIVMLARGKSRRLVAG